jgi:hypothetical protein
LHGEPGSPHRIDPLTADRTQFDDTTVRVLAKQKTMIGRLWAYDRPFPIHPVRPISPSEIA